MAQKMLEDSNHRGDHSDRYGGRVASRDLERTRDFNCMVRRGTVLEDTVRRPSNETKGPNESTESRLGLPAAATGVDNESAVRQR